MAFFLEEMVRHIHTQAHTIRGVLAFGRFSCQCISASWGEAHQLRTCPITRHTQCPFFKGEWPVKNFQTVEERLQHEKGGKEGKGYLGEQRGKRGNAG